RDDLVTGVQTCALPIWPVRSAAFTASDASLSVAVEPGKMLLMVTPGGSSPASVLAQAAIAPRVRLPTPRVGMGSRTDVERTLMRSEERRVGEGGRGGRT